MLFVLPRRSQKVLGLAPRLVSRCFVGCDILSLLIQCSGSGVAASQNWVGNTGIDVLLVGLATQLATNVVFMILLIAFYKRTMVEGFVSQDAPAGWQRVLRTISGAMVLVFVS
jgi:hypothetical protein